MQKRCYCIIVSSIFTHAAGRLLHHRGYLICNRVAGRLLSHWGRRCAVIQQEGSCVAGVFNLRSFGKETVVSLKSLIQVMQQGGCFVAEVLDLGPLSRVAGQRQEANYPPDPDNRRRLGVL